MYYLSYGYGCRSDYFQVGRECGQAKYDLKWPDGIEIPKINEVEE